MRTAEMIESIKSQAVILAPRRGFAQKSLLKSVANDQQKRLVQNREQ